jgi:acylphosphatase
MSTARLFTVRGRVQGVGYRFFAERAALGLGLKGYVRNLPDGRVEVYATGDESSLNALRGQLIEGPRAARVDGVDEQPAPLKKYRNFSIEV